MKRHPIKLHCGQEAMGWHPGQRFCNKKCAAFFNTRRSHNKKGMSVGLKTSAASLSSADSRWDSAKRYLTSSGYWALHLHLTEEGITMTKQEHIVIWERWHRKEVPQGWVIHHVNENRADNDVINLVALPKGLHRELHIKLKRLKLTRSGFNYVIGRKDLVEEFVMRATRLDDLRRQWRLEEN